MENVWLHPWNFLFAGNISDSGTEKTLLNELVRLEKAMERKLTRTERWFLYKLLQNLQYIIRHDELVIPLLKVYLKIPLIKAITLYKLIETVNSSINRFAQRHPTVLLLDHVSLLHILKL